MPSLQGLYGRMYAYLGKLASPAPERNSPSPLDLERYERESESLRQYINQWIAVGQRDRVIAHGTTLEETLQGIPKKESSCPVVFYVSPHLFEKNVRYVGV